MAEQANADQQSTPPGGVDTKPQDGKAVGSPRAAKTKETLGIVTAAIPILGFAGTLFVWAAANFYIGAVDIEPVNAGTSYQDMTVKVFDHKGQESTFHTPQFQLMPGKYHFTVIVDNDAPQQLDAEISLGKTTKLEVTGGKAGKQGSAEPTNEQFAHDSNAAPNAVHKHWWQFWKKKNDAAPSGNE